MAARMTATLGALPPARAQGGSLLQSGLRSSSGGRTGAPTPARWLPARRGQSSGLLGGTAGGALYIATGPAALAALARIHDRTRRALALHAALAGSRPTGD